MNIKRLLIIDRCLRDRSRAWTLEDLIDACKSTEKNSRRSVQADLELMRSTKRGYGAPIVVYDRKYYTYKDEHYSLLKQNLTDADKSNILSALMVIKDYCDFDVMKDIDRHLFGLHDHIAIALEMPRPERFNRDSSIKPSTVRLWVEYDVADEIRNNPLHSSQKVEFEEIDGSINIVLDLPITTDFEAFLAQHVDKIKVTHPASLQSKIKKIIGN